MANVVTYVYPVAGATAPTAAQNRTHQQMYATITGDTASTTAVITHNWGLTAAELANSFPEVDFEPLLAGYYGANPLVTTRAANSVTVTVVAFAAVAAIGVRLRRPWTATR